MLSSLSIRNVVLIDHLSLDLSSGFCALTGETGAGKSILLDSLGLALGARAEASLVRKGADQASVSAVFDLKPDHPVFKLLRSHDLESDECLVLRRSVNKQGRSKAFINDQAVSVALLKDVGNTLVEIHGQFDTQGLLDPSTHRAMLDDYAQIDEALPDLWQSWKAEQNALIRLQEEAKTIHAEEEFLRSALEDLDKLSPEAGEEETLKALRERLMHRERVLEGLNAAYHALNADHDPIQSALSALDKITDKLDESANEALAALERAHAEVQEAMSCIQALSDDLSETDHNLETIDERLFALRSQARKHGCGVDELQDQREALAEKLARIDHADDVIAEQSQKVEKTRKAYMEEAERISTARKKTARRLDELVQKELAPLKLDKARFVTKIERLQEAQYGPHGIDCVKFVVATNPGADPGPLNKIASGGEMSRFMLALKVVMAEVGTAGTLMFDEVDAGIGGSTADAVGERLARLADKRQVLVVTHAPQVAARAAHHYIVRKDGAKEVKTDVLALNDAIQRREEIARMLAGATITEEARAAADKLLETGMP